RFCRTTIDACKPPQISMAAPYRSYHSLCLALLDRQPHVCQPAMLTFTLPMGLCWYPPTIIPMTSAPSRFCSGSFQVAKSLACPVSRSSGAWVPFTVSRNSNRLLLPPGEGQSEGVIIEEGV